jgi:chromosome segregation ATPase
MELSISEKCDSLRANLTYFAERLYHAELNLKISQLNNNEEGIAANNSQIAELKQTIQVYQDELAKLTVE